MDPAAQKRLSYVEAAETAVAVLGPGFDLLGLNALRTVVSGYPDTGAPGAGEVVASLFMLLERLIVHEKRTVILLVPKSGRESVWIANLKRYLPQVLADEGFGLHILNLLIVAEK